MIMKQTAIVLSASQYSFKDEKTGKDLEGCSIHYILAENLAPYSDEERSSKGYKPAKASLPLLAYDKTAEVPGVYDLDVELQTGSDGKIKAVVVGLEFMGSLDKSGVQA